MIVQYVNCPECGCEHCFQPVTSVQGRADKHVKQRILDGSISVAKCNRCGTDMFEVKENLLYDDPVARYAVWKRLPDSDGRLRPGEHGGLWMEHRLRRRYQFRLVDSYEALAEKIRIFDDRLDDGVIEIMKWHVRQSEDKHSRLLAKLRYASCCRNRSGIRIFFQQPDLHSCLLSPEADYLLVHKAYRPYLDENPSGSHWLIVDAAYAKDLDRRSGFVPSAEKGLEVMDLLSPDFDPAKVRRRHQT